MGSQCRRRNGRGMREMCVDGGCQGTVQITRDTNSRLSQASALSPDTRVSSLLARGPPCLPTMMSQTAHQPLSDFLRGKKLTQHGKPGRSEK